MVEKLDIPRKRLVFYGLILAFSAFIILLISHLYMSTIPKHAPQKAVDPTVTLSNLVGMKISGFWTPNQQELVDSQAQIREYLRKANPGLYKKFDYYAADYCGSSVKFFL